MRNPDWGPAHEWVSRQIYHTIMWTDPYGDNELKGMLAEKYEFNDAADKITFYVNPEARWADGNRVTARDLKQNIDWWNTPPTADYIYDPDAKNIAKIVDSTDMIDDMTLQVNLSKASVSAGYAFASYDTLIKPSYRTLKDNATKPVGSTAFDLIDVDTDVKFTLVKNPNYWIKASDGSPLPYLDGVESIIFTTGERVFAGLLTGQLDIAHKEWGAAVKGKASEIKRRLPDAFSSKRFASAFGWSFQNKAPFSDLTVRKAFDIATDRLGVIELSRDGWGVMDSIGILSASAGNTWAIPTAEVLSLPGRRHLDRKTGELETDMFNLNDGLSAKYKRDPEDLKLAHKLLRDAGYATPADFPKFKLLSDNLYVESDATVNSQLLMEGLPGLQVELDVRDFASVAEDRRNGNFDAAQFFPHSVGFDPSVSLRWYQSGSSQLGLHNFQVPKLDALYAAQDGATDPAKRKELVFEMQRLILAEPHQFIIGGYHSASGLYREWVRDMPIPVVSLTTVYWFDKVWIDQDVAGSAGRKA